MDIFKSIDRELALFAGAGGGILGSKICGFRTIGAVECETYPNGVLMQRQNDGSLEKNCTICGDTFQPEKTYHNVCDWCAENTY